MIHNKPKIDGKTKPKNGLISVWRYWKTIKNPWRKRLNKKYKWKLVSTNDIINCNNNDNHRNNALLLLLFDQIKFLHWFGLWYPHYCSYVNILWNKHRYQNFINHLFNGDFHPESILEFLNNIFAWSIRVKTSK